MPALRHAGYACCIVLLIVLGSCGQAGGPEPVLISSAASVSDVLEAQINRIGHLNGASARLNTAGSQTVARQIDGGQSADIVVLAHPYWMQYLSDHQRLVPTTRRAFLSNRLVLIVPRQGTSNLNTLGDLSSYTGKLALGQPDSVPAGMYAREALKSLGVWDRLQSRVVGFPHVRAALSAVASGHVPAGIVYRTDAQRWETVRVAAPIPPEHTPPIRYEIALVRGHRSPARAWYNELTSVKRSDLYERFGFEWLPS